MVVDFLSPTRPKAPTKVQVNQAKDYLFADDCAINASCEEDMQASMDLFVEACQKFGLTISKKLKSLINMRLVLNTPNLSYFAMVHH